jgi:hypothetical protein
MNSTEATTIVAPGTIGGQKGHTMAEVPRPDAPVSGGRALIRSVWSGGVRDITAEGVEILLDSALDEGLVQDIPIVGWLVKTYGVVNSIRERIFLQKLLRFLRETQATTAEERKAFAERMEANPDYQRKVGENLFLLLDRHETVDKSELLGRVFAALVRQEISDEEFQRYAFIIDRLFLQDLTHLARHYASIAAFEAARGTAREQGDHVGWEQFLDEKTTQALFGSGLLDSSGGYVETLYQRNELGEKLIQLIGSS